MAFKPKSIASMAASGGSGMQNVHPVTRTATHPANVIVRHPPHVGAHMMAPTEGNPEVPFGSMGKTPPGGIIGGLAPFQSAKGAEMGDFSNE